MKTVTDNKKLRINVLLAALFAGVVFIAFCVINGIAPFGTETILRNDGLHQYGPFLANYISRIKEGGSVLYSWNLGGGVNQFALIAYYLLSPFNLIALPFNTSNIDIAMMLIILAKTMCIAASFCYFLNKKYSVSDIVTVIFSLIFTFSGFYICYYYNTMWLDALIALPLVALGIENIVYGKKSTLYFVALAYTIFVNFYIGYMVCIFAVLYFFYLIFSKDITRNGEKEENELPILKVMTKFGFSSLFAGMICACVILPVFFAINYGTNKSDFDTVDSLFNFFDFLSYHLTGITPVPLEATTSTAPYLMSSMLTFLTVPAFFFLKNVKPNRKVATAAIVAIFYFSFAIPKMNYFWHGFSAPANLPYRFSFIYLFFILTLAYEVVRNLKELPVWSYGISGALIVIAIVYSKYSQFSDHFETKMLVISAVATVLYLALLLLYKYNKLNSKVFNTVLALVLVAEIVLSNYQNFVTIEDKKDYYPYINEVEEIKKYIDENEDGGLNRFEIVESSKNVQTYPALYNYNGLSTFSSLSDGDFSGTQSMLGIYGNFGNSYLYATQSPIYNAMFALDYVYDAQNILESDNYYEKVAEIGNGTLYKVTNRLPIGYCVREDIKAWSPYSYLTTSVQSLLWLYSTGVKDVMDYQKPVDVIYNGCHSVDADTISQYVLDSPTKNEYVAEETEHEHEHEEHTDDYKSDLTDSADASQYEFVFSAENVSQIVDLVGDVYYLKATEDGFNVDFNFVAEEDGEIFALVNSGSMQTLTATHEDGSKKEFDISNRHLSDLGYFKKGEKYTLTVSNPDRPLSEYDEKYPLSDSIQMSVATVNDAKFLEGYNNILENGTLDVKEFDDTYIHGTVNATIDGMMMMPMPYDEGWTVYVDGEQVELFEHESHIMMFELPKGEHEIEMSYFPLGLKEGIFVSIGAVLGLVMVLLLGKVHKMKEEFIAEEEKKETDK